MIGAEEEDNLQFDQVALLVFFLASFVGLESGDKIVDFVIDYAFVDLESFAQVGEFDEKVFGLLLGDLLYYYFYYYLFVLEVVNHYFYHYSLLCFRWAQRI